MAKVEKKVVKQEVSVSSLEKKLAAIKDRNSTEARKLRKAIRNLKGKAPKVEAKAAKKVSKAKDVDEAEG